MIYHWYTIHLSRNAYDKCVYVVNSIFNITFNENGILTDLIYKKTKFSNPLEITHIYKNELKWIQTVKFHKKNQYFIYLNNQIPSGCHFEIIWKAITTKYLSFLCHYVISDLGKTPNIQHWKKCVQHFWYQTIYRLYYYTNHILWK